jgi:tRNA G10  N-methylase Trm11
MKYLFILGRNVELSVAEVKSFCNRFEIKIINEVLKKNGFFIEIEGKLPEKTIDYLGGVISIGEGLSSVENASLDKKEIYFGEKNNINYALWNFSSKGEEIKKYLKERFKKEKLKAVFKPMSDFLEMQGGESFKIPSSKRIDEEYFVFNNEFGRITQKSDYEDIERRDMEKPVRRSSLAISPRLAKIMINLSEIKEGGKLLDPFCGIGTILQEALLQNLKVVGVDLDGKAIEGAKENMEWFGFDSNNYELINESSKNVKVNNIESIATEPDLGEVLKKEPPKEVAKKILNGFENLLIEVINNVRPNVSGKIVFTSPFIKTGKKRIECDIYGIAESTSSKILNSFEDYREGQIVGRKIFVLK